MAAVCWVGHYLGGCGSLVGVEVMEWVSSWVAVAVIGWLWQLVRICQVGVGANVVDVVEESRLFE